MPSIWMDVDTALPEVPVNIAALIDDGDFVSREESVTFEQPGLVLIWNFVTTAGLYSQTAVTPTNTGGDYDWVNQTNGMYTIEIPFSGGASINNDAEGFGWFSGIATGILSWIGPTIGFRAAALNNLLVDANGLDVKLDRNMDLASHRRGFHTHQGNIFYVAPANGDDSNPGTRALPKATIQNAITNLITSGNHDTIIVLADDAPGTTTHTSTSAIVCNKRYFSILGPGRDLIITRSNNGPTFQITADGIEISGFQLGSDGVSATSSGVDIVAVDFHRIHNIWFLDTQGDGIHCQRGSNCHFHDNHFEGTGVAESGEGIHISGAGGAGDANDNEIYDNHFAGTAGTAILIDNGTTDDTAIYRNVIHNSGGWGIDVTASSDDVQIHNNILGNNASGDIRSADPTAIIRNNREWTTPTVETTDANVVRTINVAADGIVESNLKQIDGLATNDNLATLKLKQLDVTNATGTAVILSSSGENNHTVQVSANGTNAHGISIVTVDGTGLFISAFGVDQNAVSLNSRDSYAVQITTDDLTAIKIDSPAGIGIQIDAATFGIKVDASNGPGVSYTSSGGNGDGIVATAHGTGKDINGTLTRVTLVDVTTTNTDTATTLGSPAGASVSTDIAAVKTDTGNLVTRIPAALFAGITSIGNWLGALAGKTADAATQTEIRATTAGVGYTITTDGQEAIRDRGDAAWITAVGFNTTTPDAEGTAAGLHSATDTLITNRTLLAAAYFDFTTDSVVTDAASRTASKATGFAVAGDAMALTSGERTTTADVILLRQMSNIDNATEDSYSLYSLIMARLNSEIISGVWTTFQTDGTTTHQEKDVESSASANAVTKVSG